MHTRQCLGLAQLPSVFTCCLIAHFNLFTSHLFPSLLFPNNIHLALHQPLTTLVFGLSTPNPHCPSFHLIQIPRLTTTNMADWETSTSNDGGAAAASFAEASGSNDTAAHATADATADPLDMTPLAGALTEAEVAAFKERAQEAGWVATQPVDYSVRQSSRDDETAHYLANSAVYEWNDEYGDVGPEVPELEEQLFGGHFRVRQGEHMKNLQFEVTVEGPDRLQPARSVSTNFPHSIAHSTDHITVRHSRPASDLARHRDQQDGLRHPDADPGIHHPSSALRSRCHWHLPDR